MPNLLLSIRRVYTRWKRRPARRAAAARTEDEPRFLVVGTIGDRFWSAVVTHRGENVRIISVRRSRPEEVAIHEGS